MQFTLLKQPHGQQQKFLDCTAREQLFGGAKRGGKSAGLCMKAILLAYFFPGNRILLCRKDFTDLWDTTLSEFWQVCPRELLDSSYGKGGHHRGERTIRLKTIAPGITSDIVYRGLGDWDDLEKVKSFNSGAVCIDEATEIDFETYKMVRAQMTWVLPNGNRPAYMVCLTSNPEPGWVKERFMGENKVEGCAFIPSLPRQNPFLPLGWEDELRRDFDKEWIDKYLDGSWDVAEGQVFPELNPIHHAIEPIETVALGLMGANDYATTGVTAFVLCGVDHDKNLYALHEYYERERLLSYSCHAIRELINMYCPEVKPPAIQQKLRYNLIDPATNARTQQGFNKLQSVADQYREHGLMVVPAWNAIESGYMRLKEMLHVKEYHIHPLHPDLVGSPSLFIVKRNCPNLWKEMREHRKEILPSGQIRYVGAKHALDCLRYVTNSLPKPEALTKRDQSRFPLQDQFMKRAHDKWIQKWDRTANAGGTHPLFIQ